jgi:hypothetical protein
VDGFHVLALTTAMGSAAALWLESCDTPRKGHLWEYHEARRRLALLALPCLLPASESTRRASKTTTLAPLASRAKIFAADATREVVLRSHHLVGSLWESRNSGEAAVPPGLVAKQCNHAIWIGLLEISIVVARDGLVIRHLVSLAYEH